MIFPMDTLKMIPIAAPQMGEEERQAVLAVLDSGQLAQGPTVEAFEHEFARWCGVPHAVARIYNIKTGKVEMEHELASKEPVEPAPP